VGLPFLLMLQDQCLPANTTFGLHVLGVLGAP